MPRTSSASKPNGGTSATSKPRPDAGPPQAKAFQLSATGAARGAELVVWTPTGADTHKVHATGVDKLTEHIVPGGRIVTALVASADYKFVIEPA